MTADFETVPVGTLAKLERMREALRDCRKEFWDEWHSHMALERFNADPLIMQINAALEDTL